MLLNKIRKTPLVISSCVALVNAAVGCGITRLFTDDGVTMGIISAIIFGGSYVVALMMLALCEAAARADDASGTR